MRIAQVAPLVESVPPKRYGGTERIVAYLTEELVRLGHKVTLFASGDSVTAPSSFRYTGVHFGKTSVPPTICRAKSCSWTMLCSVPMNSM